LLRIRGCRESPAVVERSDEKGGIPFRREPLLYCLVTDREALQFYAPDYDARVENGKVEAVCVKLSYYATQRNAQGIGRVGPDI
jgi:hypothetical protein